EVIYTLFQNFLHFLFAGVVVGMTKKRKSSFHRKPWCWYCDREFEDEKVLTSQQEAKHINCNFCHNKLNSASGLVIHIAKLHKETITKYSSFNNLKGS